MDCSDRPRYVAASLTSAGAKVTMVFPEAGVTARVLPDGLARFVCGYFREKGVEMLNEETVALVAGTTVQTGSGRTLEADELAQALKTIAELEAVKAASALFNGEEPISPKAVPGCPKPEQPGLHRAGCLRGSGRLEALLLRVQVPRAVRSRDPPTLAV